MMQMKQIYFRCSTLLGGIAPSVKKNRSQHRFTLIELLVSKTCQICVYILRKMASCLDTCRCNSSKCGIVGFADAKTAIH
ncbi:MAG: hypothetical protein E7048_03385, partial [Lentisphaerae bacterium]|nr:hypothetical protein [Lentisphaerota bacterium]